MSSSGLSSETWIHLRLEVYGYDVHRDMCFRGVPSSPSYYRAEQYDSDLGLYYLRARYYNPLTGRFLSRDPEEYTPLKWTGSPLKSTGIPPIDPKKLHKYLYAGGDPVNMIDPRGLDDAAEEGGLDAEVEKAANSVKTILKYKNRSRGLGYCIDTTGTEDYFDFIASKITCLADVLEDE